MKHHAVIDERLASTSLFQGLSKRNLELVAAISTRLQFEAGKVLAAKAPAAMSSSSCSTAPWKSATTIASWP